MSNGGAAGGGAAAAAHHAMVNAVKASGAIVRVAPEDFLFLLNRAEKPLVVTAAGGVFGRTYRYIFGHRGLVFFTRSKGEPLNLPGSAEVIRANSIWIPN